MSERSRSRAHRDLRTQEISQPSTDESSSHPAAKPLHVHCFILLEIKQSFEIDVQRKKQSIIKKTRQKNGADNAIDIDDFIVLLRLER